MLIYSPERPYGLYDDLPTNPPPTMKCPSEEEFDWDEEIQEFYFEGRGG